MIFEHIVIDLQDYIDNNQDTERNQVYILLDDNVDNDYARIVAQAISLDIRGDFGFFLNKQIDETEMCTEMEYEWTGNLFHIIVNTKEQLVKIEDITDEEGNVYDIDLEQWQEALSDWKNFYLKELGFLAFSSMALSHMMGVLILTYDQMDGNSCSFEMVIEAIKKCADRYGVNKSVIYRDCKKVTGVYDIRLFYYWVIDIFEKRIRNYILNDFVLYSIDKYGDVRPFLFKHFGVIL